MADTDSGADRISLDNSNSGEDLVICPIDGCNEEVTSRGLFMHVFHTNDPEGQGHYPKFETPPEIDRDELTISGTKDIEIDYPDTQDLEDRMYLDTYTGKAYKGKRGLMVHLGQMAGKNNIPEDVTDRHDAIDFPIVETDDEGNITEVIKGPERGVPAIEPYLPWYNDDVGGYIAKKKVLELIEKIEESEMGAASAEMIQRELLG